MSASKPTRDRAFGLRIVSPTGEAWHFFASFYELARDLRLRLYKTTQRLDHGTDRGYRSFYTVTDVSGEGLSCLRKTPYQAEHSRYGATIRIRIEWTTYEAFDARGVPLPIHSALRAFDLADYLSNRRRTRIAHGDRGKGPVPGVRKSRGGSGWFRHIRTANEIRLNAATLRSEGEVVVRGARSPKHLPTSWSDLYRDTQRSWKKQRKTGRQWMR